MNFSLDCWTSVNQFEYSRCEFSVNSEGYFKYVNIQIDFGDNDIQTFYNLTDSEKRIFLKFFNRSGTFSVNAYVLDTPMYYSFEIKGQCLKSLLS